MSLSSDHRLHAICLILSRYRSLDCLHTAQLQHTRVKPHKVSQGLNYR